jgi:hypothetical protein
MIYIIDVFNVYTSSLQGYFTHTSNNILTHHVMCFKTHDVSYSLINDVTTHY